MLAPPTRIERVTYPFVPLWLSPPSACLWSGLYLGHGRVHAHSPWGRSRL